MQFMAAFHELLLNGKIQHNAVNKTYVEIAWCLRNKVVKFKTKLVSDNDLSASIPLPCY